MCFTLGWFENLLILIVVVCAVIGLLQLLISFLIPRLGIGAEIAAFIVAALKIVFWAVICIALIIIIFDLIACLLPMSGSLRLR